MDYKTQKFKHPILAAWMAEGVCSYVWDYVQSDSCSGDEHPVEFIGVMTKVLARVDVVLSPNNPFRYAMRRDFNTLVLMTMNRMKELEAKT